MDFSSIHRVYFVGIGGIGMSALARFFNHIGKPVAGYDRTSTSLTRNLEKEGMQIHYEDSILQIPADCRNLSLLKETLVIYTPAIPASHTELNFFRAHGFNLFKRSQVLGLITKEYKGIAVAGSHGKSTLSAMLANILHQTQDGCSAFLGAISKNFDSNLVLSESSEWAVMEADEFDRSFLHLEPQLAIVTSMDPDHLDVYGAKDQLKQSFTEFLGKVKSGSSVLIKFGLDLVPPVENELKVFSYGFDKYADFYPVNIRNNQLGYLFDLVHPEGVIKDIMTNIPGWINVENATGAAALALWAGANEAEIKTGISGFSGVKRRFDVRYHQNEKIYLDDYAHHPKEIKALISSIRKLFPDRRILGIFQPHLFTRTRDFAEDFGHELNMLDELLLLNIYPAREEAIPGVSSKLIFDAVKDIPKKIIAKEEVLGEIKESNWDVLLTIGAGDIDLFADEIELLLNEMAH